MEVIEMNRREREKSIEMARTDCEREREITNEGERLRKSERGDRG